MSLRVLSGRRASWRFLTALLLTVAAVLPTVALARRVDVGESPVAQSLLERLRHEHGLAGPSLAALPPRSDLASQWAAAAAGFERALGKDEEERSAAALELLGVQALVEARLAVLDRAIEELGSPATLVERQERARVLLADRQTLLVVASQVAQGYEPDRADLDRLAAKSNGTPAARGPILRAGGLPYGPANLPPRAPKLLPVVVPSWLDPAATGAVAADYAPSPEAPISPTILAQAEALGFDPLAIWNFVRNEVRRELYAGSVYGAEGALARRAANDVDQASLLIALLRSSGMAARYAHGVVELSRERLAEDFGVSDPIAQGDALRRAGIAASPVIRGGGIAAYQVDHTFVSAWIPYGNYRGTVVDFSSRTWIPLAPALERQDLVRPSGLLRDAGINVDLLVEQTLADPLESRTPLEVLRYQLELWLAETGGGVLADHLGSQTVRVERLNVVPQTLPVPLVAVTGEAATLDAAYQQRLIVTGRPAGDSTGEPLLSAELPIHQLAGREVVLAAMPSRVEDHEIVNQAGGLDAAPAWLVEVRLLLSADGEHVAVGETGVGLGNPVTLTLELVGPWGRRLVDAPWIAGAVGAIQLGDVGLLAPPPELPTAMRIFGELAAAYSGGWGVAEDELAALLDLAVLRPLPALVLVGNTMRLEVLGGLPWRLAWDGAFVDAAVRVVEPVRRDDPLAAADFVRLAGLEGSARERAMLERELGVTSVSADRVLAAARAAGAEIVELPAGSLPELADSLAHPFAVRELIADQLDRGLAITVPRGETQVAWWIGSGWIARDPVDGSAGYFLSGALAGGQTGIPPNLWPGWLAAILAAPYSGEPNRDPFSVVSLEVVHSSDEQVGIVGTVLPRPLTVIARDHAGRPVEGVDVTFELDLPEGGMRPFDDEDEPVARSVVVRTGRLGLAAVTLELGRHTALAPFWLTLQTGDPYPTRGLGHYVAAQASGRHRVVSLRRPFRAVAVPGAPARLQTETGRGLAFPLDVQLATTPVVGPPGGEVELEVRVRYAAFLVPVGPDLVWEVEASLGGSAYWTHTEAFHLNPQQVSELAVSVPMPAVALGPVLLRTRVRTVLGPGDPGPASLVGEATGTVPLAELDVSSFAAAVAVDSDVVVQGLPGVLRWSLRELVGLADAVRIEGFLTGPDGGPPVSLFRLDETLGGFQSLQGVAHVATGDLELGRSRVQVVLSRDDDDVVVLGAAWLEVREAATVFTAGAPGMGLTGMSVSVLDGYDNPVSNAAVRFTAGEPVVLSDECLNAPASPPRLYPELVEDPASCPDGIELWGRCGSFAGVGACADFYAITLAELNAEFSGCALDCNGDPTCEQACVASLQAGTQIALEVFQACQMDEMDEPTSVTVRSSPAGARAYVIFPPELLVVSPILMEIPNSEVPSLEVHFFRQHLRTLSGICTGASEYVEYRGFETSQGREVTAARSGQGYAGEPKVQWNCFRGYETTTRPAQGWPPEPARSTFGYWEAWRFEDLRVDISEDQSAFASTTEDFFHTWPMFGETPQRHELTFRVPFGQHLVSPTPPSFSLASPRNLLLSCYDTGWVDAGRSSRVLRRQFWSVDLEVDAIPWIKLGLDDRVDAPIPVHYTIFPAQYSAAHATLSLFQDDVEVTWYQGTGTSGRGSVSIPVGEVLSAGHSYEVQVVLNRGFLSEIRSERFPLQFDRPLFSRVAGVDNPVAASLYGGPAVTVTYDVEVATQTVCRSLSAFQFHLTEDATVTLTARPVEGPGAGGRPDLGVPTVVFSGLQLEAGSHAYAIDLGDGFGDYSLPAGDYVFELHGVGNTGIEHTVEGFFHGLVNVRDSRPIGHELVRGIDLFNGSLSRSAVDFEVPGRGPSLRFARTYNSGSRNRGPLGESWTHVWDSRIVVGTCGNLVVQGGDGGGQTFREVGDGTFEPGIGFHGSLVPDEESNLDFFPKSGDRWHYERDLPGTWRLAYVEDPNGNRLSLRYRFSDGGSQVAEVTDASGRSLLFEYEPATFATWNSEAILARILGPDGFELRFAYDEFGLLESVRREGDARAEHYTYSLEGDPETGLAREVLAGALDEVSGALETWSWQSVVVGSAGYPMPGLAVTENVSPEAGSWSFLWDVDGLAARDVEIETAVVDARGATTLYTADLYGSVIRVEDALDHVTLREWDPIHRTPTKVVDPRGVETTWSYDEHGNVTAELVSWPTAPGGPESYSQAWEYQPPETFTPPYLKDRLQSRTDRAGQTFTSVWDSGGNLLSETTAVDALSGPDQIVTTSHAYLANGDRVSTTDPRGFTTRFAYDQFGLPALTTDARGGLTATTFDVRGRLRARTDAELRTTAWTYDTLDREVLVEHPDETSESTLYDDTERTVLHRDELNRPTTTRFDLEGRVVEVERADGSRKQINWSPAGDKELESSFFGNGTPRFDTTFEYDALGRLEVRDEPEGRRVRFGYDAVGNVTSERVEDRNAVSGFEARETQRDYDGLSRVVAQRRRLEGNWFERSWTLDGEGRPLVEVDERDKVTYRTFDGLGRLLRETGPEGWRVEREWDPGSLLSRETTFNTGSAGARADQVRSRQYDELGRVIVETDAEGKPSRTQYDKVGNAVVREDRRGVRTEYAYDERDRVLVERLHQDRFTTPARVVETTFDYDDTGNRIREDWANGNTLAHHYDPLDRLRETTDDLGLVARAEYDARGNVTARVDGEQRRTESAFDGLDREVERREPAGRETRWTWDVAGNRLSENNPRSFTTQWRYDTLDRVTEEEDADEEVTVHEYDATGNRTATTDRRDYRTEYEYDDRNRLVRTTDPVEVGTITEVGYDEVGNVVREVDRLGFVTLHQYDRENRRTLTTRNGTKVSETRYDAAGQPQVVLDGNDHAVTYERDERGAVLRETRDLAAVRRYTLDVMGDVLTEVDEENRTTTRGWDLRRRLVRETNHAGETTEHGYDLVGNRVRTQRPLGQGAGESFTWGYRYDAANRLDLVTSPLGHTTAHEWDRNGNRTATVDAEGRRTEWEYDILDRPTLRRLADGTEEVTGWDEEGNRNRFEDGRGVVRTWAHDALGRPTVETLADPAATAGALTRIDTTYDGNGNATSVTESFAGGATRLTTRTYDDFDRLFSETTPEGTLGWRYDLVGNRTRQIDSSGAATVYTFDALNRPTTVTTSGPVTNGGVTSYSWLRDGRLATVTHPQGAIESRSYDAAGRVEQVTSRQHGAVVTQYLYSYDDNGNRLTQDETNGGAPERTTYAYDNSDRLVSVEYPGELVEYTLDAVGNRTGERTSSLGGGGPPVVTSNKTFTFDNRHRLVSIVDAVDPSNNASWTFDAAGNQTSRTRSGTTSEFTWDGRNRLLEVGEGGTLVERYGYDHLDRRVSRAGSGEVVRYLWDEESILEVHDGAGLLLQKYEYGPDRLLSLWDATAPVAEARQFQLFDGLGSITALVRGDGLVQARRLWDAWGVSRGEVGESSNRFGFTGHEHDEATGLIYAKARYLDPELGRFLSEDPFAGVDNEPPSLHRYLYGYANPTVYWDPTGRENEALMERIRISRLSPELQQKWEAQRAEQQAEVGRGLRMSGRSLEQQIIGVGEGLQELPEDILLAPERLLLSSSRAVQGVMWWITDPSLAPFESAWEELAAAPSELADYARTLADDPDRLSRGIGRVLLDSFLSAAGGAKGMPAARPSPLKPSSPARVIVEDPAADVPSLDHSTNRHLGWSRDLDLVSASVERLGRGALRRSHGNWVESERLFEGYLTAVESRLRRTESPFGIETQPAALPGGERVPSHIFLVKLDGSGLVHDRWGNLKLIPYPGSRRLDAGVVELDSIGPRVLVGFDITLNSRKRNVTDYYFEAFPEMQEFFDIRLGEVPK